MRSALSLLAVLASTCIACSPPAGAAASPLVPARGWQVTLSPAPDDLSLLQIRFPRSDGRRLDSRSLRARALQPFGSDYLALAALRGKGKDDIALALLVDRPSALLDPASVRLRLKAWRGLGLPRMTRLTDPFARSASAPRPALCDLPLHGRAASAADLLALGSQGAALTGLDVAGAVSEAYDAACGLAPATAFEQAVECSAGSPACCPVGDPCPLPPPTPTPAPPHCAPCDAKPGYACPLAARTAVCVADLRSGERQAASAAH
jgi:hypothetical protein